mmetsp:Transcript_16957/g.30385  ORF Transcript_16957/g.30385 Transcript_16957/m.30385 type:complete len:248 (+) Transcript_16957:134-877(+)
MCGAIPCICVIVSLFFYSVVVLLTCSLTELKTEVSKGSDSEEADNHNQQVDDLEQAYWLGNLPSLRIECGETLLAGRTLWADVVSRLLSERGLFAVNVAAVEAQVRGEFLLPVGQPLSKPFRGGAGIQALYIIAGRVVVDDNSDGGGGGLEGAVGERQLVRRPQLVSEKGRSEDDSISILDSSFGSVAASTFDSQSVGALPEFQAERLVDCESGLSRFGGLDLQATTGVESGLFLESRLLLVALVLH